MNKFVRQNVIQINNYIKYNKNIIFLNSYPRSGNTWLRLLISDLILQNNEYCTQTKLQVHQDLIFPDIHSNIIDGANFNFTGDSLLIKTHLEEISLSKQIYNYKDTKNIILYRNPQDSLVSFYHFKLKYKQIDSKYNINKFCLENIEFWNKFYESYLNQNKHKFISYENLVNEPIKTIASIANYMNINHSLEIIEKALNNMSFEKLRNLEFQKTNDNKFFRKGQINTAFNDLEDKTLCTIRFKTQKIQNALIETDSS